MTHISYYSGGIGSWAATVRVAAQHGTADLHLVFADTLIEDDDLYRFVIETAGKLYDVPVDSTVSLPSVVDDLPGRKAALAELRTKTMAAIPQLHWIAEGRTPWEVFKDERYVGNSRKDPCSKLLKREFMDRYCRRTFRGQETVHYFGIDWTEEHRITRVQARMVGQSCVAPLCSPPYLSKQQCIKQASQMGIAPPRLYGVGASHNNCGLFCVKSGQAQFALLLRVNPKLYAYHEAQEQAMMSYLGRQDCTIMKCRRGVKPGSKPRPLSLQAFRIRLEQTPEEYDKFAWGGCGCAL